MGEVEWRQQDPWQSLTEEEVYFTLSYPLSLWQYTG